MTKILPPFTAEHAKAREQQSTARVVKAQVEWDRAACALTKAQAEGASPEKLATLKSILAAKVAIWEKESGLR